MLFGRKILLKAPIKWAFTSTNITKRWTKKHTKYRLRVSIFGKIQEYSRMIKYGSAIQMVTGFTIGTEDDLSKKYSEFS